MTLTEALMLLKVAQPWDHYECDDQYYSCPQSAGGNPNHPRSAHPCDCYAPSANDVLEAGKLVAEAFRRLADVERR